MALEYDDVAWERDRRGNLVIIGRGATGIVYAGKLHGQPVAIKAEVLVEGEEEAWLKAARLHCRAACPHIAALRGVIVDRHDDGTTTHYLVMERLAGTLTSQVLARGGAHYGADMALRLKLLADVAGGLAYLHSCSVIHADVKPDNVLLTAVSRWSPFPAAKLADFGSSVQRRVGTRTRDTLVGERGTVLYMDPRLFDPAASITAASDVYSFGMMAWQLLSGRVPYEAEMVATLPPTATGVQKLEALRRHVVGGGRPPVAALVERGVAPSVVALVESCWAPAQASRPAMVEVHRVLEAAAAAVEIAPAPAPAPPTAPPAALQALPAAPLKPAVPIVAPAPAPAPAPRPVPVPAPLAYGWGDKVVLHGHSFDVRSIVLLPGGRLVSGDAEGTVRLWDAAHGGEATAVLGGHGGFVFALVTLPDGCSLAAGVWANGGRAGTIVVWDTEVVPPTRRATIDCGSGVVALAVLLDGRLAAGCVDRVVWLVEVCAGASTVAAACVGHTNLVAALAVLPDGTLASRSYDNTVRLWEVGTRTCGATLVGYTGYVNALAVLADGRLASGSGDKTVRLWDLATRTCVDVLGHISCVWALAVLPDGRLASGSDDNTIQVWDTRSAAAAAVGGGTARVTPVVLLEGHTDTVFALQPLPGGRLASGSGDKTMRLWRLPPC